MKIVKNQIKMDELRKMAKKMFGNLVKAVVDVEREIMAVDGELHADEEALLIKNDSKQKDLWGINIYPDINDENWIEFDSVINIKPLFGNKTRGVEKEEIRNKIITIVNKLIKK